MCFFEKIRQISDRYVLKFSSKWELKSMPEGPKWRLEDDFGIPGWFWGPERKKWGPDGWLLGIFFVMLDDFWLTCWSHFLWFFSGLICLCFQKCKHRFAPTKQGTWLRSAFRTFSFFYWNWMLFVAACFVSSPVDFFPILAGPETLLNPPSPSKMMLWLK